MTYQIQLILGRFLAIALLMQGVSQILVAQSTPQVNKKFAKKVSVEVSDVRIGEFLLGLAEDHKVSIEVDNYGIAADGFSIDNPISLRLNDVTLLTVIKLASETVGLTCSPKGAGVFVSTPISAREVLDEKQYNLPWIHNMRVDARSLAAAIETTTPGPWMTIDAEGGEFTAIAHAAFKISQNWENHREIANILFQIASIVRGKGQQQISPFEIATLKSLTKSVEVPSLTEPLDEFLQRLLVKNGINLWIDRMELNNEGIKLDVPTQSSPTKQPISSHLAEALQPHQLIAYVDGEVVKISTIEADNETMVTRVYDVRQQVRQLGSTAAVADALMKTPGTEDWFAIAATGGEIEEIGPLLVIRHHRKAHDVIRKSLQK